MPKLSFVVTGDGHTACLVPGEAREPNQTRPHALREQLFQTAGVDALLLHDGGLALGLERAQGDVHMEALGPLQRPADTPYIGVTGARPWQRPGWYKGTLSWLQRRLGERVTRLEQVSTYDLACVLRLELGRGAVFLKASETALEADVTAHLCKTQPELTPRVLLAERNHHLLVTGDGGERLSDVADLEPWRAALSKLARFQRTARADGFQALGCPVHNFSTLGERSARFLQDTHTLRQWGLSEQHLRELSTLADPCQEAHKRVQDLGLPLLPHHGDAHPMNVLVGRDEGRETVWFDWSEAGVAHPLLDAGWFFAWLLHPPRRSLPVHQAQPHAVPELWRTYLDTLGVPEVASLLPDIVRLALLHRALVYHARFFGWQGTVPGWRPEYVPFYLRSLLSVL